MSNLMHKVKDAMTGHHHSEDKGSSHDSSNVTKMDGEFLPNYPSGQ